MQEKKSGICKCSEKTGYRMLSDGDGDGDGIPPMIEIPP